MDDRAIAAQAAKTRFDHEAGAGLAGDLPDRKKMSGVFEEELQIRPRSYDSRMDESRRLSRRRERGARAQSTAFQWTALTYPIAMSSPTDIPVQAPSSTPSITPPSSQVARKRTHTNSGASSRVDSEVFSSCSMRTARLQRDISTGARAAYY